MKMNKLFFVSCMMFVACNTVDDVDSNRDTESDTETESVSESDTNDSVDSTNDDTETETDSVFDTGSDTIVDVQDTATDTYDCGKAATNEECDPHAHCQSLVAFPIDTDMACIPINQEPEFAWCQRIDPMIMCGAASICTVDPTGKTWLTPSTCYPAQLGWIDLGLAPEACPDNANSCLE